MAQLNISLSPGDAAEIRRAAQSAGRPVSNWVVDACRVALGAPSDTARIEALEQRVQAIESSAERAGAL